MSKKQPPRPRTTEEILREMENMSSGELSTRSDDSSPDAEEESHHKEKGGALKSLLGFFVKVVPEEEMDPQPQPREQPPRAAAPPPATTARSGNQRAMPTGPRVADLVAGEPEPKFETPEAQAGDLSDKSFEQIYAEAGLGDSTCSVDELAKLLDNPTVANQPLSVKIIAVNLTLSAKGIGVDVPIADAMRRDRALDAYQQMLAQRTQETEQRNAVKIEQVTKETEEYLKRKQAEIEALRAEIAEARRQSVEFSIRREAEEKRLAGLISPFLEGKPNPVTVGNQSNAEASE